MKRPFDYSQDFSKIDFREEPHRYQVGKGEQGVLSAEPYKSEILPHWRFRTPEVAEISAKAIYRLFEQYKAAQDFVGMDMARKFLQMGFTRSRRYANRKSGRKYSDADKATAAPLPPVPPYKTERNRAHHTKSRTKEVLPLDPDPVKAESARIFYGYYEMVKNDPGYQRLKREHQQDYG